MTQWTTWARVALLAAVCVVAAGSCRLEPGKRFSWSNTIETEFGIGDGEDRMLGYWHFTDPFELNPGKLDLKLGYRADKASVGLVPDGITLRMRVYDPAFSTMKFEYDLDTTGKMKQAGCCAYRLSFKGSDNAFPGWNLDAGDNMAWSVVPKGGVLPLGTRLGVTYAYLAR